jgi:hypothetical protein
VRTTRFFQVKFVVVGASSFPIDMLRYDFCFPDTQQDVNAMDVRGSRCVTLVSRAAHDGVPTRDRWKSFGWEVIEVTPS